MLCLSFFLSLSLPARTRTHALFSLEREKERASSGQHVFVSRVRHTRTERPRMCVQSWVAERTAGAAGAAAMEETSDTKVEEI